jgi:hypothetical protein
VTSESFLYYPEKPSDPVKPDTLVAHKYLVRALTDVCPNLSFGKKQLEAVFAEIAGVKRFKALNTKELAEDWVETMSKRIQIACRHVAQARLRKPPPKWLAHIDNGDSFPMTQAGSTQAGSTQAGSTQAGSTQAGSTQAESAGSEGQEETEEPEPREQASGEESDEADAQRPDEDPIRITDNMHITARGIHSIQYTHGAGYALVSRRALHHMKLGA